MIKNFSSTTARDIFDGNNSKKARKIPIEIHGKIQRLFDQLNAAPNLEFMKVPPGNRLEALKGDLAGKWSIRVNDQWRVIFKWENDQPFDVLDYHRG